MTGRTSQKRGHGEKRGPFGQRRGVQQKGKTILRHASAKVVAEYGMSKTVSIPMEQTVQVPVGEVKNYRYLNLFGKRFPLFLSGGNFYPKGRSALNGCLSDRSVCAEWFYRLI